MLRLRQSSLKSVQPGCVMMISPMRLCTQIEPSLSATYSSQGSGSSGACNTHHGHQALSHRQAAWVAVSQRLYNGHHKMFVLIHREIVYTFISCLFPTLSGILNDSRIYCTLFIRTSLHLELFLVQYFII